MKPLGALFLIAGLAMPGCSGDLGVVVEIGSGHVFLPAEVAVDPGQEVTFSNLSAEAHTVTAYSASIPAGAGYFASGGFRTEEAARQDIARGLLTAGETFSLRLEVPGTYRYFCIPHEAEGMTGTIIVPPLI